MSVPLEQLLSSAATVITPNRRLARDLKRRFDATQIASGPGAWPTADILPWSAWLERIFGELTRREVHQRLLSPVQELALWQQVIADLPGVHPLLDTEAASRVARDAWQVQQGWRLDVAAWRAGLSEDGKAFAAWSSRFREVCASRAWLDGARLADAIGGFLRKGASELPQALVLYGFDQLSPQQNALIDACRAAGMLVEERHPDGPQGDAVRMRYPTSEDELAHVALRSRQILAVNPAARIGIVVPDLARQRGDVIRLFDDVLEPDRALPGTRVRPRPYNVSLGIALSRYPLVYTALSVLRLVRGELSLQDTGALLRSPFLAGAELEFTRRALLDARLRRRGRLVVDLALLRNEARARSYDDAHACRMLSGLLEIWSARAAEAKGRRQLPSAWSSTFFSLLSGLGWPGERVLDSEEFQTFKKWRELVSGLSDLDPVLGSLRYDQALSWLARLSADTLFQAESEEVPIQILGVLEAAGIEFDHLFVTGIYDEAWPQAVRPNPLLPAALQRACKVPHASAEWEMGFAQRMTALWLQAAPRIVLSHPTREGDRMLRPSALLSQIPEAAAASSSPLIGEGGREAAETTSYRTYAQTVRASAQLERLTDNIAPPLAPGYRVTGGASVFQNQAACPFRAFAIHRLGACGLEEGRPGLDARERGTLLHRALAQLWSELKSHARLMSISEDDLRVTVEGAVDTAIDSLRRNRPDAMTPAFAALERARIAALAARLLEVEKRRAPFQVLQCEQECRVELAGLQINGRIDRIDGIDGGAHVILDYKTGDASPGGWMGDRPDEPQLPFYAITDTAEVAAVSFATLRPQQVAFRGLSRADGLLPGVTTPAKSTSARCVTSWEALLESWRDVLDTLAREFLSGHAAVAPKHYPRTCEHCDLGGFCRVKELFDRGPASPGESADE